MWNMVLVRHWMVDVLCKLKRTTVNESRYSLFWSFFTNSVSPQCRPISLIGYDLLKVSVNKHDFLYMNIVWDARTTFTLIESIRLTPYSTDNEGESESDRKSPKERKIANCKNTCSTICLSSHILVSGRSDHTCKRKADGRVILWSFARTEYQKAGIGRKPIVPATKGNIKFRTNQL